jgi:ribonuclease T2
MRFKLFIPLFYGLTLCFTGCYEQRNSNSLIAPDRIPPVKLEQNSAFDYYVMAMSWSPEYCSQQGRNDAQQCGIGRRLGFVLHGLWPQYERGYPQNCSTEPFPQALKRRFAGLYPSDKLFTHEWKKHGTCAGISAEAYLTLSQQLKQSLRIPRIYQSPPNQIRSTAREMKMAFAAANNGFTADSFAPMCRGSFFRELLVCYDTLGNARTCSADVLRRSARSCRSRNFTLKNVR